MYGIFLHGINLILKLDIGYIHIVQSFDGGFRHKFPIAFFFLQRMTIFLPKPFSFPLLDNLKKKSEGWRPQFFDWLFWKNPKSVCQ